LVPRLARRACVCWVFHGWLLLLEEQPVCVPSER
jgi:hypothetical protein